MRRFGFVACFSVCLMLMASVAVAQEEGDAPRRRGGQRQGGRGGRGGMPGGRLIPMADANNDEAVTEGEWNTFVASFTEDGKVNAEQLRSNVFAKMMDADKNQKFEVADLQMLFDAMDQDKSGALEEGEMGRRGFGGRGRGGRGGEGGEGGERRRRRGGDGADGADGRRGRDGADGADGHDGGFRSVQPPAGDGEEGGDEPRRRRGGNRGDNRGGNRGDMSSRFQRMMFRPILEKADTDGEVGVTADEWSAFKKTVKLEGGAISTATINTFLAEEEAPEEGRRRRRSPGMLIDFMTGNAEGDLTVEKLNEMFTKLDANGDKTIDKEEASARASRRGGRQGRGPVF